jgi:CAAX prenyl protease-like protein
LTVLSKLAGGVSVLVVSTYALAMVLTVLLLTSTSIGQDMASHQAHLVLGALLIPIQTPIEINVLATFLVLIGIFFLCFAAATKSDGGLIAGLRQLWAPITSKRKPPNWLIVMPLVSSALLVIVVIVTMLQDAAGIPTGSLPSMEPYQWLYVLAYAPPVEETMFRISTLGLLVTMRTLWSRPLTKATDQSSAAANRHGVARIIALGFLAPETAKGEVGMPTFGDAGWRAIHWTEWLVLIITSVGFGLAHVLSGAGWELGKVAPAALSGFALGLAYLLYGAYASILLHWFFNVYFEAFSLSSSLFGGGFIALEGIIGLLAFVAGAIGIVRGILWLLSGPQHPDETTYMVPSTPAPS